MLRKFYLQFFADGGTAGGGEGDGAGVSADNPGQNDGLDALGIPADKAEKFRARRKTAPQPEAEPASAAEPAAQLQQTMPSWDEFFANPDNNKKLQATMQDRLSRQGKKFEETKASMDALTPALRILAGKYGLDANKLDAKALAEAITGDDSYYEEKAAEMGVDTKTAKRISELERTEAAMHEQQEAADRDQALRQHFMAMQDQSAALRQIYPDFNLETAMQDPKFIRLTAPETGLSVEEAFHALYGRELMEKQAAAIAQRAKVDAASAIRSGANRPRENSGSSGAGSAGPSTPNFKNMTHEERLAYIMKARPPRR